MKSQRFWRSLFFFVLIAALCGGLALPATLGTPVRAAPQLQTAMGVVISEFRFRGSGGASDEFIEIFNATGGTVNLNGWKVRGSNASGTISDRFTFPNVLLAPGQHFLLANTAFDDGVAADDTYSVSITLDGGVALTLSDNTIIDEVGLSAGSAFSEGTPLPSLTTDVDQGYERLLGGISGSCEDINNNSTDFVLILSSAPQNLSSAPTYCVGVNTFTPTNTSTDTPTSTNTSTATSTGTSTNTPTITNTSPPAATGIVISEFRTRGPAGGNDEFIELYNPTGSPISIANWMINKSSGCGTSVTTIATIPATVALGSGEHYLIGDNTYSGSVAADLSDALSIADNGGIALLQSDGVTIIDQVGLCATTSYLEGTALIPLTTSVNRGYDRKSTTLGSCVDSNNNAADFILRTPSDPQNSASPLTVCGNPTLTPTPTRTPTRTRTPTPRRSPTPFPTLAPQPLVAINEFVPRPGHDWNNDGAINVGDEYIEIINHGVINVSLGGYSLDDEVNIGSTPYRLPSVTIEPGERLVFYGSQTGLLLSDGGDGVRLLKPNGQLVDAYNYFVVNYPDQGYCRLPDDGGLDDWNTRCFATPGLRNSLSGSLAPAPDQVSEEPLCPLADTQPNDFVLAECPPFGNNIWRPSYWDKPGWYGEKRLPDIDSKWDVYVD